MAYLSDLAGGLRAAAGVLSPDVQKQTMEEDQRNSLLRQQQAQLFVTTLAKQVADGVLPKEAAKAAAASKGLNVPPELFGGPSVETQARQTALSNERGFREAAASAGGDFAKLAQAAVQFGKPEIAVNIFNAQEQRQARAQERLEALQQREREFTSRLENQGLDRESRERLAAQGNELKALIARGQQEIAAGNQQLRALQVQVMGDQRNRTEEARQDKKVTDFANDLQQNKVPALSASVSTANDLLKKYEDKDIPGLGVIVGSKRVPSMFRSEEANNVRSTLAAVSNDLLNLYSGLAVTLPEAERRELEEMKNGGFTSQDFKNAWPRIVNRYNAVVGNLSAGAGPETIKRYQSRPGAMRLDALAPAFAAKDGWGIKEKR